MKGNVNPFEPWRPWESRIPPRLYAGRPWRPPPPPPAPAAVEEPLLVEPVKPPPRNKSLEQPKRQQRRTGLPSWVRTLGLLLLAMSVYLELINVGLIWMGWFEETQVPRVLALDACVLVLGVIMFYHRRGGRARLPWMAFALALAGMAAWFMPTLQGVNLWSAYRQVEELRVLPAGDVAGYQRGAEARRTLVEDFPSFAEDVSAAEQAWLRRTVDQAIENADRQLKSDPHTALANLQRLIAELPQLKNDAAVRKELESARRRAVLACAKAIQREAGVP